MAIESAQFDRDDVDIQEHNVVYQGFFDLAKIKLRHRQYKGTWSRPFVRELLIKSEAASSVVYDPVLDLIGLVEQFRIGAMASPFGPWTLEGVAGMVEEGESPADMMLRELSEEAGLEAKVLMPITGFYPTPGGCDEFTHLYCAICDLSAAGGHFGVDGENEDIFFRVYPADQIFDAMLQNRTNNAATLIGLFWLQGQRAQLRQRWPFWS